MWDVMKFLVSVLLACAPSLAAASPELSQVTNVYLLPMTSALDQYLANRLTSLGVFQVVTDPQKADAIFTDHLGESFEKRMAELYPPPPPPEPPKSAQKAAGDKDKDTEEKKEDTKAAPKEETFNRPSSFARGRGNLFLVSRKSRDVIWSMYEQPKNSSPQGLDEAADRVVKQLKKDLGRK